MKTRLPETVAAAIAAVERAIAPCGDALLAFDTEVRLLHWSAAMERISGFSAVEVLGRLVFDVFPFLKETGEERGFLAALAGQDATTENGHFLVPETDREGFFDAFYSPLIDGGVLIGGLAIVRDTTEQIHARAQMRETERRFTNMADAAPVLLWMAGTDSLCNFFNKTWLEFTGRTLEQEWGVGWAEGVHFEDLQRAMDAYLGAFNRREPFEIIYRLRRRDGEFRWILDRGVPRYNSDDTFAGYIGSCVDITGTKQLEDELRQSVTARDDFLAIAAHELRTPLTPIQLTVQTLRRSVLRKSGELDPIAQKLATLEQYVFRQSQLVEGLLDVSRITTGPISLSCEPLDLAQVVSQVALQFADEARRDATDLRWHDSGPIEGRWDRARLDQIVSNLISNALKYGKGKPVDIELGTTDDNRAVIRVRDRGIGITVEDQARIFDRFERAVSPSKFGGFGLGLWITRKLANAMGGTIAVESRAGEGATFTVELPRAPAAPLEQDRAAASRHAE